MSGQPVKANRVEKTRRAAKEPHPFWRLWGWPIGLGCVTACGLVSALFSDGGLGDAAAWVALGLPVITGVWYGWLRR